MKGVERKPVMASFWQFDPDTEEEGPQVEAMDAALAFHRGDEDRILVAVRGKDRGRYEHGDSVWLEFTDAQALRFIERMAATLREVAHE